MIQTDLLNKKSICHALIASTNSPDVFIPVKGVIEDIHFNDQIPFYDIRIIKFYDNIEFLRKFMNERAFLLKYKGKSKAIVLPKGIKTASELETWFSEKSTYRFCVESTFVVRTKNEMVELYNKIQEYIIVQNLRAIRNSSIRSLYDGPFKISSKIEFNERFRRMFGDRFSGEEIERLFDSI
jgi:hypothetical protein